MAKKLKTVLRLQIEAGKANPAPPIGPALAPHGINLMAFCKDYNVRTSSKMGEIIPAEISIYTDGSFTFILKDSLGEILAQNYFEVNVELSTFNLIMFYLLPIIIPIGIILYYKNKEIKHRMLRR